jgi:hypothetical protein
MRIFIFAGFLAACGGPAQAQAPDTAPTPETKQQAPAQIDQAPPADKQAIVIPAGTRIQLRLVNSIHTHLAKRGDAVRATTAFPVTVGTALAIPADTFVEGQIEKIHKRGYPAVQVHFTRLVFNNGYALLLDGATAEASTRIAAREIQSAALPTTQSTLGAGMANLPTVQPPPTPQPPPLPKVGPNMGIFVGVSVAITAATLVTSILWARHRGQDVTLESGSTLEMVLERPLSLDADAVAAAVAAH